VPQFKDLGVPVYGISTDSIASHQKFVKKHALNFPLISDPDHALAEAFGVWVEKSMYGKKYFGIQRSTFVIAHDGTIEHAWEKVPDAAVHAAEVVAYLHGGAAGAAAEAAPKKPAKKAAKK
jgi:thioredoxin-dependent peroxiredoxin